MWARTQCIFACWLNECYCACNIFFYQLSVRLQPAKSRQSQVKSKLRLVVSLLLHCLFIFFFFFLSYSFFLILYIYNWTTSNAYISVNSQPIWVKFWILHLMTNPNKVYDTTPNLNHSKSQLISTTSNA